MVAACSSNSEKPVIGIITKELRTAMPASNIDLYQMQDARNNFDAMRPAPVCADANQFMGQCQNIHISTNCYYGYHDPKPSENVHVTTDCEMLEEPHGNTIALSQTNSRKRNADDADLPQNKRFREGKIFIPFFF